MYILIFHWRSRKKLGFFLDGKKIFIRSICKREPRRCYSLAYDTCFGARTLVYDISFGARFFSWVLVAIQYAHQSLRSEASIVGQTIAPPRFSFIYFSRRLWRRTIYANSKIFATPYPHTQMPLYNLKLNVTYVDYFYRGISPAHPCQHRLC